MQGRWAVVTFVLVLVLAGVSSAEAEAMDSEMCPAPISICHPFDTADALVTPAPGCPPGSICTCVPSCPTCLDCPVQVCIPGGTSECRTACDCPTGLGCFDGRCIAGIAPGLRARRHASAAALRLGSRLPGRAPMRLRAELPYVRRLRHHGLCSGLRRSEL